MRLIGAKVRRLSAARVALAISVMALFVAMGGVGEAKKVLGKINGSSIKKGSIPENRLSKGAIAALRGSQGPQGLRGPAGPTGTNPAPTAVAAASGSGNCPAAIGEFCKTPFLGAWGNYGSAYAGAAFWRDIGGDAHISGLVSSGANNGCTAPSPAIFYLPAGYRPAAAHAFAAQASGGVAQVTVHPDGRVTCDSGDATTDLLLDGIEFQPGY